MRAAAVLGVAWSHWERPYQFGLPFGAGVHLFYVLSGFLITGILLNVRDGVEHSRAMRAFYVRRALRIVPAFYVTLLLAWWADVPLIRESLAWHVAYLSNVHTFARAAWPGSISHLWSLAVEEQFYLLWPWLIVFAPRRWLAPAVAAAILVAPIFRWWLALRGVPESLQAVLMPGCLDSLGVGALIAVHRLRPFRIPHFEFLIFGTFLAWVVVSVADATGDIPAALVATKQTLQACVFGWMIARANDGFSGVAGRMLSSAPARYIGRISYGVYLAHGFAGAMALAVFSALGLSWPIPEPWRLLVLCGVTIGAAALSWHLMERPINALKRLAPYSS